MAQTQIVERQYPLYAVADVGIANMGAGNEAVISLPPNAMLVGLTVDTVTAFNSATTATINVGDGTTTFVSVEDAKTAGREAADAVSKFYPSGGDLTVALAETGAAELELLVARAGAIAAEAAGETAATRRRTEPAAGLLPIRAEFVVFFALLRIAEDLVGLVDLFEFFLGRFFVLGQIGMVLAGQLAEGLLDFVSGGRFGHADRLVVVAEFHRRKIFPGL